MIDIIGSSAQMSHQGRGISRRDFLRVGAIGTAGLTMGQFGQLRASVQQEKTAPGGTPAPKAKSVILVWLGGGPAHVDMFDPKPTAGADYAGPYRKPIDTNVKDVQIGQKLPLLARQADKYSILRGMTHGVKAHETATYLVQTGTMPSTDLVYPSLGAVVSFKKRTSGDYKGDLPAYVSVTRSLNRFNEGGFLGDEYKPFATGGDPNATRFNVEGLASVGGMTPERRQKRRKLIESVDRLASDFEKVEKLRKIEEHQKQAYGMILGDAKKAFDMAPEKEDLRKKYGRNRFGQSCLLARRLVERGVPFVTINDGGWDTHKNHFERMEVKLPQLDAGLATLLEDLALRGLLQSTIVLCLGEFGRTPKIAWEPPWQGGRHHFGDVFSALVAGGGFRGGQVVGKTDTRGEKVIERPVYPWDLSSSMYRLLGIDPTGQLPHPQGCVAYVTPKTGGDRPSGGMLKEIM